MAITQHRSKRKPTGGRYHKARSKRLYEKGNKPTLSIIGEKKTKTIRTRGGNSKTKILRISTINLIDTKKKKAVVAKLKNVLENSANRNFVRRNILTKGAVVETDKGKARITNRPGQEGTLNGVLI